MKIIIIIYSFIVVMNGYTASTHNIIKFTYIILLILRYLHTHNNKKCCHYTKFSTSINKESSYEYQIDPRPIELLLLFMLKKITVM